jgi:hypothetical protein
VARLLRDVQRARDDRRLKVKLLTHVARRGILTIPGVARLKAGQSEQVSDAVADALMRVEPPLPIEISDVSSDDESQPEAHQGEGQATANDPQEE